MYLKFKGFPKNKDANHLINFIVRIFVFLQFMRKLKNEELDRKSIEDFKVSKKLPLTIVLDNIRSLNNIGSVFRTADAFLVEKIYLCGITASPPHKDIQKTALGASENVAWEHVDSTIEIVKKLQSKGISVWPIEQTEGSISLDFFNPKPKKSYAFILGNEVKGVDQKVINICKRAIEIPQFGTKHSLNISVATGLVIWDFFTKTKL